MVNQKRCPNDNVGFFANDKSHTISGAISVCLRVHFNFVNSNANKIIEGEKNLLAK